MTQARFGHPITSDATPVAPSALRQQRDRKFTFDPLETRLWDYYDKVEGLGTYISVLANGADLVTYYPAMESDDPDGEPLRVVPSFEGIEDTEGLVERPDVWDVWEEFGGESWLSTWASELVRHMSVPGQAWLVPAPVDKPEELADSDKPIDDTEWQVWSTKEVRRALGIDPDSKIPDDDSRIWRIWMPHPEDHKRADSAVRRVADKCEILVLLDRRRIGDSRTRLYAGVWPLPVRLRDEKTKSGKSWADLLEEDLIAPVNDPAAPQAVIPTMLFLEPDEIEALQRGPISLAVDDPERIDAMEDKVLRRIAIGIDAPQELILGMGDLNHWQAWLIDKATYSQHLDPLLVRILRSLGPWWRAQLKARGISDLDKLTLWRNPATAIATPNRFDHAQLLHERFVISDKALRREGDFGDDDAPSDEEIQERIRIARAQNTSLVEDVVDEEGEPDSDNPADSDDQPTPQDPPAEPIQAQAVVDRLGLKLARIDETLLARAERTAAEQVNKMRRKAIDRIVTAAKKAGIDVGDRDSLPARLGPSRVAELVEGELATPEDFDGAPFADAIETAQDDTAGLVEGRNREADADDRSTAVGMILAALAAAIGRSLFKGAPSKGELGIDGSEFVPFAEIRTALDTAGGGAARQTAVDDASMLVANGLRTVFDLTALGFQTEAFEWVYGSIPRTPFPPHQSLDGIRFSRWDDPILENNTWVSGSHFFPGDHRGCRCTVQRTIVETGL